MDRHSQQQLPQRERLSSLAAPRENRSRYKPLAPREPANNLDQIRRSHSDTEKKSKQSQSLAFVNVTDPQQSKSRESRRFVRTQVMKNFTREKRRQNLTTTHTETEDARPSSAALAESVIDFQRLLIQGLPRPAPSKGTGQPVPCALKSVFRHYVNEIAEIGTVNQRSKPDLSRRSSAPISSKAHKVQPPVVEFAYPGQRPWPVELDLGTQNLLKHCFSPSFRACHPLYMISLLANRPNARFYPLFIDIDHLDGVQQDSSEFAQSHVENFLFKIAETSPALANALLMVAASHSAICQGKNLVKHHTVIHHKDLALRFLNEAVHNFPKTDHMEALATIAVMASQQLMIGDYHEWTVHMVGFSRIVNMSGGLASLSPENLIRKLIVWCDEIGALFMNTRPFFSTAEVADLRYRPRRVLHASLQDLLRNRDFLSEKFRNLATARRISTELVQILEDISVIAELGAETIFNVRYPAALDQALKVRELLLHRLLSLAPDASDEQPDHDHMEDEHSDEECIRLAALVLVLDRLFHPVLPPMHSGILDVISDRLSLAAIGKAVSPDWASHTSVMLWICFTGATTPRPEALTTASLIHSAAPLYPRLLSLSGTTDGHGSSRTAPSSSSLRREVLEALGTVMGAVGLYDLEAVDVFATQLKVEYEMQSGAHRVM